MLVRHARTGHSMGVPETNTLIINNGDVVELTADSISKSDPVKAGIELLDQSRNGIVDARVLKERQQLAEDGIVTILAAISTDGAMVAPPRVNLRGVVTTADARKMSLWTEREIKWVLENRWKQLTRSTGGKAPDVDWMGVQREVEVGLGRRMRRELQVEPLILCLVQPAPAGTPVYKGRADSEPDDRPAPRGRGGRHGAPQGGNRHGGGRNRDGGRNREATPARVIGSAPTGAPSAKPVPASTPSPSPASAPTKVQQPAAAQSPAAVDQEMPAGRTRRRRSAAA
jgi:ribonuclease J